ncbi:unnamed protein product, partial [Cyprideis torosa]
MGLKIDPKKQRIVCDNRIVEPPERLEYYLLNKPKGYVTTAHDPQGRPVVTSLVRESRTRLFPVGRLDLDTEGALLLTNDGELAQAIQHPSHQVQKTYETMISGHLLKKNSTRLEQGIILEGKVTAPCTVSIIKHWPQKTFVRITIHEGRKHQ